MTEARTPFDGLGLDERIRNAIARRGYERPTPIQARAIPFVLAGHDVVGVAQTGTGKTAAFLWPTLQRLLEAKAAGAAGLLALVVAPTRELARQIHEMAERYAEGTEIRVAFVHGAAADRTGETQLAEGAVELLIATPGRLQDLENRGVLTLSGLRCLVVDEFDRMLDLGFLGVVEGLLAKIPEGAQKLLFSATLPRRIRLHVDRLVRDAIEVAVDVAATPAQNVEQKVYFVRYEQKTRLLAHLIESKAMEKVLVFTRRKSVAEAIAGELREAGIAAEHTHGDLRQRRREEVLARFDRGDCQVLVASDLASRGLDVEGVTHVVNFDLPHEAGTYVHRIGRTGRAGKRGVALSFCDERDFDMLRHVELLLGRPIPVVTQHAFSRGAVLPPVPVGKGGLLGRAKKRRRGHGHRRRQR